MRVHRAARRSRPALHARADRARRHCRARRGHVEARRALRNRNRADRHVGHAHRARPRGRLRSGGEPARGNQDLSRQPRRDAGQPSRAALGAGEGLCAPDVRRARSRGNRRRARVFRHRVRARDRADGNAGCWHARDVLRRAVRVLRRLGRTRDGPSRRARRGAACARVSARTVPQRPARTGGGRLSRGTRRAVPDGASADRHRQDARHRVPAAEGMRRGRARPRVFPDRENTRPRARARSGNDARRQHVRAAAARAGTRRARQGVRASGQRVSRRIVPPRERLLRPAAGRARCGDRGRTARSRYGAHRGARARRLSVLPGTGTRALVGHGDRRLQLLLRRQRDAAHARAAEPVARRRARRRSAQPARSRPQDVQRVARSVRVRGRAGSRARRVAQGVRPARPRVGHAQSCAGRALCGLSRRAGPDRVGRAEPRRGDRRTPDRRAARERRRAAALSLRSNPVRRAGRSVRQRVDLRRDAARRTDAAPARARRRRGGRRAAGAASSRRCACAT